MKATEEKSRIRLRNPGVRTLVDPDSYQNVTDPEHWIEKPSSAAKEYTLFCSAVASVLAGGLAAGKYNCCFGSASVECRTFFLLRIIGGGFLFAAKSSLKRVSERIFTTRVTFVTVSLQKQPIFAKYK